MATKAKKDKIQDAIDRALSGDGDHGPMERSGDGDHGPMYRSGDGDHGSAVIKKKKKKKKGQTGASNKDKEDDLFSYRGQDR